MHAPPRTSSPDDIARILDTVAPTSWRQGLSGAVLALGMAACARAAGDLYWLALFGTLFFPLALASLALAADRVLQRRRPSWTRMWIVVAVSIGAGAWLAALLCARWAEQRLLHNYSALQLMAAATGLAIVTIAIPLWYGQRNAHALRLARLEQAAVAAELKTLQAQTEPHFLYNTLANARYLARHDPAKAASMLDHLIAYLHHALPDMRSSRSTVAREFDMARHFLSLMTIRFGDRLTFELDCPPAVADAVLPPLMLMPLVENAVKHGVEPHPGKVHVVVSAAEEDGSIRLLVRDDGAGIRTGVTAGGVGLRNLRERLSALYARRGRFELRSRPDGGTEAEIVLPRETEP